MLGTASRAGFPERPCRGWFLASGFASVFPALLSNIKPACTAPVPANLPERFSRSRVGLVLSAWCAASSGGLSRNRRFRGNVICSWAVLRRNAAGKQEYAQQGCHIGPKRSALLATPDDGGARRCSGNTCCGGSGCRPGRARCSLFRVSWLPHGLHRERVLVRRRRPWQTAGMEALLQPLPPSHTGGASPVFRFLPQSIKPWLSGAPGSRPPVDEHGTGC